MSDGPIFLMDGFLWKKRSDVKKSMLGGKYQKRFFKLTTEGMAYAACAKDFKGTGARQETYPLNELMWVRRREKVKISMKFPNRMLRIKCDTEVDCNQWFKMLEEAREQYVGEIEEKYFGPNSPTEQPKEEKYTTYADDTPDIAKYGNQKKSNQSGMRTIEMDSSDSEDEENARRQHMASASMPRGIKNINTDARSMNNPRASSQTGPRPPSPRSLLANPRVGSTMVSAAPQDDDTITLKNVPKGGAAGAVRAGGIGRSFTKQVEETLVLDGPGSTAAHASSMAGLNLGGGHRDQEEVVVLGGTTAAVPPPKAKKPPPGRIELGGPAARSGYGSSTAEAQNTTWLEEDFDSSEDELDFDGGGKKAAAPEPTPARVSKPESTSVETFGGGQKEKSRGEQKEKSGGGPKEKPETGGVADDNFADDDWDDDDA
eukprot:gene9911-7778_t